MSECSSPDAAVKANYENPTKKFSKKGNCEVGGRGKTTLKAPVKRSLLLRDLAKCVLRECDLAGQFTARAEVQRFLTLALPCYVETGHTEI